MVDRGLFLLTAGVGCGKTVVTIAAVEELAEEFGESFAGVVVCAGSIRRMLLSHPDQLVASGQTWLDAAEVHDAHEYAAWTATVTSQRASQQFRASWNQVPTDFC